MTHTRDTMQEQEQEKCDEECLTPSWPVYFSKLQDCFPGPVFVTLKIEDGIATPVQVTDAAYKVALEDPHADEGEDENSDNPEFAKEDRETEVTDLNYLG